MAKYRKTKPGRGKIAKFERDMRDLTGSSERAKEARLDVARLMEQGLTWKQAKKQVRDREIDCIDWITRYEG